MTLQVLSFHLLFILVVSYYGAGLAIDGDTTKKVTGSNVETNDILVVKKSGKVAQLEKAAYALPNQDAVFTSHSGIAHTRWATHGPPNEASGFKKTWSDHDVNDKHRLMLILTFLIPTTLSWLCTTASSPITRKSSSCSSQRCAMDAAALTT